MKGQVFTIAKLHYINGVVYKVAEAGKTTIETLAGSYPETTKSGNAKHPEKRVRDLWEEGTSMRSCVRRTR